jgi:hypothetical protein
MARPTSVIVERLDDAFPREGFTGRDRSRGRARLSNTSKIKCWGLPSLLLRRSS